MSVATVALLALLCCGAVQGDDGDDAPAPRHGEVADALAFDGTGTCVLAADDLRRAEAFYVERLGLRVTERSAERDAAAWVRLATPIAGLAVRLEQAPEVAAGDAAGDARRATSAPAGKGILTFGVKDLDAARAALERHEVAFEGETFVVPGLVKLATFADSEGNVLKLFELLQPHAERLPAAPPLGATGAAVCALPVSDLRAASSGYRDVLGRETFFVAEEMAWAEVDSPVPALAIGLSAGPVEPGRRGARLEFAVADLGAAARAIADRGGEVVHAGEADGAPVTVLDRDGNAIVLVAATKPSDTSSNGTLRPTDEEDE